jgi:hypothetical protein
MAESELASDARSREIGLVLSQRVQRHTSNVSGQRGHRRECTSSNPVIDYYQSQIPSEHQVLHSPLPLLGFIGDELATQRELTFVPCFRDAPSRYRCSTFRDASDWLDSKYHDPQVGEDSDLGELPILERRILILQRVVFGASSQNCPVIVAFCALISTGRSGITVVCRRNFVFPCSQAASRLNRGHASPLDLGYVN